MVETQDVRVEASRDNAERLALFVPGRDEPIAPTHWTYGQEEGVKDRPCAVLLAVEGRAAKTSVVVLPVTHSPPKDPTGAIESRLR